jgi:hypothetical protein
LQRAIFRLRLLQPRLAFGKATCRLLMNERSAAIMRIESVTSAVLRA